MPNGVAFDVFVVAHFRMKSSRYVSANVVGNHHHRIVFASYVFLNISIRILRGCRDWWLWLSWSLQSGVHWHARRQGAQWKCIHQLRQRARYETTTNLKIGNAPAILVYIVSIYLLSRSYDGYTSHFHLFLYSVLYIHTSCATVLMMYI